MKKCKSVDFTALSFSSLGLTVPSPTKASSIICVMGRYPLPAFLLLLLLFFQGVSIAQSSIPARYDGFPYGDNLGITNGIIVEAFLDPLCPDSRDSWPPLKQVLLEYHPRLSLLAHPFPLPFGIKPLFLSWIKPNSPTLVDPPSSPPLAAPSLGVLSSSCLWCMIDPEVDHGFAYNERGEIDILISPFYEPDWEYDETVERYVKRILYCLVETIDLQKPKTPWLLVGRYTPSPYHDNSFVACRALHIANMLNVSATYPLLELFFKYQVLPNFQHSEATFSYEEKYYNGPTKNLSREAIVDDIARLGAEAVGNSLLPAFKDGFINSHTDSATRTSFKYGCTRGVFGTPFFFVNGFLLPNAGSALDYETWKSIIDPLLRNNGEGKDDAAKLSTLQSMSRLLTVPPPSKYGTRLHLPVAVVDLVALTILSTANTAAAVTEEVAWNVVATNVISTMAAAIYFAVVLLSIVIIHRRSQD
ncbi:hypothetical protein MA16_Dca026288 [Dendrobium catenatum]|uniref:Thioredoxin-like fold domain-containing protein n=1 Tax=Dendrobium catenatum TaxID=906689 RepID=A0A2I0WNW0_9ASPA|nr:hypothetical protein MA16_Dca026288 [Dendrobium catenatum]